MLMLSCALCVAVVSCSTLLHTIFCGVVVGHDGLDDVVGIDDVVGVGHDGLDDVVGVGHDGLDDVDVPDVGVVQDGIDDVDVHGVHKWCWCV